MKNTFIFCYLLTITPFINAQEYNYKNLSIGFKTKDIDFYQFEKLRLYPIYANNSFLKHSENMGKYIPLQKALTDKKIIIAEINAIEDSTTSQRRTTTQRQRIIRNRRNGQNINQNNNNQQNINRNNTLAPIERNEEVNTLSVQNISKDTIYIMAGEIIQGGKQDRVIAKDIVLPPMTQPIELPVFCVEQGRWEYDQKNPKENKKFQKYYGTASLKLRSKVEKEVNQQSVWSEVTRSNNENNTKTETQAYTAQIKTQEFQQNHQKYVDYFKNILPKDKKIIGVVVVTGNQVVGCDMFASPQLFQSQFESLLTSYVNEAMTDGHNITIEPEIVKNYVDNLLSDTEKQNSFIEKKGKKIKHKEINLRFSTF